MTDEQIEALARAIGATTDFDGDRMASRYTDSELRDMAKAAITAMPDRYAQGVADERARVVGWLRRPRTGIGYVIGAHMAIAIERGEHLERKP